MAINDPVTDKCVKRIQVGSIFMNSNASGKDDDDRIGGLRVPDRIEEPAM
jgi:hypothetical protein